MYQPLSILGLEIFQNFRAYVLGGFRLQLPCFEAPMYSSDARSQVVRDLDLYNPPTSGSYKYVGVNGNTNKVLFLQERSDRFGALCELVDWQPVWNDRGSDNKQEYNCWIPVGPPGFVTLGVHCRFVVAR